MLSKAERDHWRGLLATDYGIIADLHRLDGEFDLNVAVEVRREVRWVLKIIFVTLILTCQFPGLKNLPMEQIPSSGQTVKASGESSG